MEKYCNEILNRLFPIKVYEELIDMLNTAINYNRLKPVVCGSTYKAAKERLPFIVFVILFSCPTIAFDATIPMI
jgi:hypothetical protein